MKTFILTFDFKMALVWFASFKSWARGLVRDGSVGLRALVLAEVLDSIPSTDRVAHRSIGSSSRASDILCGHQV